MVLSFTFYLLVLCLVVSFKLDVDSFRFSPRLGPQVRSSWRTIDCTSVTTRISRRGIPSGIALNFYFDADTASNFASSSSNVAQSDSNAVLVAANTFIASATTRLTGILIGNLLAGVFVKYVTDIFKSGVEEKRERDRGKTDTSDGNSQHALSRKENAQDGVKGLPSDAYVKLVLCLIIDLLGDTSFVLPGVGELEDVAWAPMSAYALRAIFGSNIIAGLDFVKEILPATDLIPIATLAWFLTYVAPPNPLSNTLGLNAGSQKGTNDSALDWQKEGTQRKSGRIPSDNEENGFIDV